MHCLMAEMSSFFPRMFLIISEAIFFTASNLVRDSYVIHHMIMKCLSFLPVERHTIESLPFLPAQRHRLCKKENLYQAKILSFL
mgnify:CR=1 FL=1